MVGEAELTTPSMGGAVEGGGLGTTINGAEVPGLDVPPVTETSSHPGDGPAWRRCSLHQRRWRHNRPGAACRW